jgi:hypothetical protein
MSPSDPAPSKQAQAARDDLAFMKSLVDGAERSQAATGKLFVAAGLLYGLQMVGHWLQASGRLALPPLGNLAIAVVPTAVFLVILTVVLVRESPGNHGGSTNRAFQAVFSAAGLTNLVLAAVFAPPAIAQHDIRIWLFFPCVVYALQGGAWFAVWTLRRRGWMLLTALGYFAFAVAMGATIGKELYILFAGLGMLLCMVLPGLVMMRQGAKAA